MCQEKMVAAAVSGHPTSCADPSALGAPELVATAIPEFTAYQNDPMLQALASCAPNIVVSKPKAANSGGWQDDSLPIVPHRSIRIQTLAQCSWWPLWGPLTTGGLSFLRCAISAPSSKLVIAAYYHCFRSGLV